MIECDCTCNAFSGQGKGVQAEKFKESATTTITTVEAAAEAGNSESVDLTELRKAENLLEEAQSDLIVAEDTTRGATTRFEGVIIFVGVCAIVCAILGLLCVFVRVCSFPCRLCFLLPCRSCQIEHHSTCRVGCSASLSNAQLVARCCPCDLTQWGPAGRNPVQHAEQAYLAEVGYIVLVLV